MAPFPAEFTLEVADAKTDELFDVRTTRLDEPVALTHPDAEFYLPYYDISEAAVPGIQAHWLTIRATLIMGSMLGILCARNLHRGQTCPAHRFGKNSLVTVESCVLRLLA